MYSVLLSIDSYHAARPTQVLCSFSQPNITFKATGLIWLQSTNTGLHCCQYFLYYYYYYYYGDPWKNYPIILLLIWILEEMNLLRPGGEMVYKNDVFLSLVHIHSQTHKKNCDCNMILFGSNWNCRYSVIIHRKNEVTYLWRLVRWIPQEEIRFINCELL